MRDRADEVLQNQGAEQVSPEERRRSRRYPFRCRLRYKSWTGTTGAGRALNMSCRGVYFIARDLPLVGQPLELLIDWPVKRPEKEPLKLVVLGRVVRREEDGVAMTIQKYWFQTPGFGEPDLEV